MTTETTYGRYKQTKVEHPDALILMRCGDFYETYEDDAKAIADITGITLTSTRKIREACRSYLRMAGFPHFALDTYLPRLIRAGYRVAIVD